MRGELLFFCRRKRQVTVSGRFSQKVVTDDRSWEVPKWPPRYVESFTVPQSSKNPKSSFLNVATFEKIEDRKTAQNALDFPFHAPDSCRLVRKEYETQRNRSRCIARGIFFLQEFRIFDRSFEKRMLKEC